MNLLNIYLFVLLNNEKTINSNEIVKINKIPSYIHILKRKSGYDFRNDLYEEPNVGVLNNIQKHEILMKLESDISIFEKILIIEKFDKTLNYAHNIANGGLLDRWNDVF